MKTSYDQAKKEASDILIGIFKLFESKGLDQDLEKTVCILSMAIQYVINVSNAPIKEKRVLIQKTIDMMNSPDYESVSRAYKN